MLDNEKLGGPSGLSSTLGAHLRRPRPPVPVIDTGGLRAELDQRSVCAPRSISPIRLGPFGNQSASEMSVVPLARPPGGGVFPASQSAATDPVESTQIFVRQLLEQDDVEAARKVLDSVARSVVNRGWAPQLRDVVAAPTVTPVLVLDVDRSADFEWIRANGPRYPGRWVAVDDGQLLASAATLRDLLGDPALRTLNRKPLIHRVT